MLLSNVESLGTLTKNLPTNSGLFSSTSSCKTSSDNPVVLVVPVPTKEISSPNGSAILNVQVSFGLVVEPSVVGFEPSVTFILLN